MKMLLGILLTLLLVVGGAFLYARSLPQHTTHTRAITLQQSPEAIFALLSDLPNFPKWNRNTEKVEMLPPIDGKEATRQTFKGNMQMTVVTAESTPTSRLVRTVKDDGGNFTGSWTYQITPAAGGSEIVLTEESDTTNAFFRLMAKLFGQTKYMDEHLEDLAKNFGQTVTIR